uniref:Kelch domain-containing protein 3 n=1 Tax=Panagrolaimus sp. JU765 TaxID=591449 RepID=A0AC34R7A6_9BILA
MWWTIHLDGGPKRVNHAAVAVGDKIFSFGGYCSGNDYDSKKDMDVFVLDTLTNRWYNLSEIKPKRSKYWSTKNQMLRPSFFRRRAVQSGEEDKSEEEDNAVVDENEHPFLAVMHETTLRSKKDAPNQRYGHTVVAYNNLIYLWGGRNDQYGSSSTLHEFNPATKKWRIVPTEGYLPSARDGHSAVIWGSSMFIFGGFEYSSSLFSNDVYEFSFESSTWKTVRTSGKTPSPRDFHASCVVGNKMYVFGGRGDDNDEYYCDKLFYLDLDTKIWAVVETKGDIPKGRRSHTIWNHQDKLYMFGGFESKNDSHFNDLYRFDPTSSTWTRILADGQSPCPRRRHCACLVDHRVFIFGGTTPCKSKPRRELTDLADLHVLDHSPSLKMLATRKLLECRFKLEKLPFLGQVGNHIRNCAMPNQLTPVNPNV